jgi:hypothetical protein
LLAAVERTMVRTEERLMGIVTRDGGAEHHQKPTMSKNVQIGFRKKLAKKGAAS